ncbi:DegT/DnrJ/EryC1/StrS family aminotransferase [Microbacterium testaceum]|uniref:DegT/DnrJ/EryC1/StrS family aminotransferase n=1 Tax=Microbacterium testaceum TaxID=2033 RepID=UPI001246AEB0|nr:DegT/DnrJ/EryC1/StrS family aminotransferase [Microbacterium testaceum]
MSYEIPFIRPVFPPAATIASDVTDIVESNWFTNFGPKERDFATRIAAFVGDDFGAATFCNATIALVAALSVVLGDPVPTDTPVRRRFVIVPSFTFAAGPQSIHAVGREPLLIDVDGETLQPSLAAARNALRDRRSEIDGILLCNSFGVGNPDVGAWEELAAEHGVPLVIDSAAGFGSVYPDGAPVGARGTCEVFSFHATKPFAIGEGGAIISRDLDLIESARSYSNFGFASGGSVRAGLNGKLQEINAAIGLRQLERFEESLSRRRELLRRYALVFEALPGARLVPHAELSSVCFATIVLPDEGTRDAILAGMRAAGVEARVYYAPPVHQQPRFVGAVRQGTLATTDAMSRRCIALPVFEGLPEQVFHHLADIIDRLTPRST